MLKILNIVGARPNFMKIAPLIHEMKRYPDIDSLLIHTGQHYDDNLSKVFFSELNIPEPDINLGVGSGSREEQIAKIKDAFEPVLVREMPDLVLVVGDVNSTIACAGVAKKYDVKVVHVEAGLRSFDLGMPEEHNRRETDEISDYLFVTEQSGMVNLESEKTEGQCHLVGNCMIDTLVMSLEKAEQSTILEKLSLSPREYMAATFHRPSNVDRKEDLETLMDILGSVCERGRLVLPIHPRTRNSLEEFELLDDFGRIQNLVMIDPLGYIDFLKLISCARAVVTDSGGIQEETTYLGIPCLTMRDNTERPVTISLGTNILVGSDPDKLLMELDNVLQGRHKKGQIPPFWDGKAASRIVDILRTEFVS